MARLRHAAKKALWKDLTGDGQFWAFVKGDSFARDPWAHHFSGRIYHLLRLVQERCGQNQKLLTSAADSLAPQNHDLFSQMPLFKKARPESIEDYTQQLMREAVAVLFACYLEKNGTAHLRNLADYIDHGKGPASGAVDRQRAWLWMKFSPWRNWTIRPLDETYRFAEIRDAFDNEFPDNSMADPQLRTMVKKELGIRLSRDKPGPRGPRIR